jgi:PAS domain S-box-containing protein
MRARNHHVFAERAMLALGLVMLGGYTGWSLHADRVRIEDRERQRLTDQVRTVDDNLERQLGAINFALKGLQRDLPVLLGRHGGVADLRLLALRTSRHATMAMDAPLVISASRDLGALFEPWRRDVRIQGTLFGLLALASGVGLFLHQVRQVAFAELEASRASVLRKSDERMRLFFDRQLVGMAITSNAKNWVEVNDRLCRMLGYSRAELMVKTWEELTHPEDLARSKAEFALILGGEIDSYATEKRYIRKDGSMLHAELSIGCVRKADATLDYLLVVVVDITERTRFQGELAARRRELEDLNASLEARVFEPYFSTKARGSRRGMGLGLALCEAIVRGHGGSITAESAPGEGAAFTIHLPVEGV